jgi:pimeloyl-ACP methyl ester carboxylesterase
MGPAALRTTFAVLLAFTALACAKPRPFAGTIGEWSGFERVDFEVAERTATVVRPRRAAPGRPWLWRGEFFGAFAEVDRALLAEGWHVAYLQCKNTFGSPDTMRRWEAFYRQLTREHRLSRKPVLLGMSRGGLYVYSWAAAHPETVGFIYGDAPVCDVKSWPGGKGRGQGSPENWKLFREVYGLTEDEAQAWRGNPIDILAPIAAAKVPILHVVGDADDVVPVDENTDVLRKRYEALGGQMHVIVKKGVGHHPHSLADPKPVLDYIRAHRRR